jgi:hypothetical protein
MQEGSQQIYLLDCMRKQDINLHLGGIKRVNTHAFHGKKSRELKSSTQVNSEQYKKVLFVHDKDLFLFRRKKSACRPPAWSIFGTKKNHSIQFLPFQSASMCFEALEISKN